MYYKIDTDDVNYRAENENEVSELEIQNIIAHFKKLGKNTSKYAASFDGNADFREQVYKWVKQDADVKLAHTVVATPGGSGAVSSTIIDVLDKGETLIIPEIAWGSYKLMATMNNPKLLLLDEHTAALDPKTALKVLTLSAKIVEENNLTTLMITHNMKDAIVHGNRLIMMMDGNIILDIRGEEKKKLTVEDLLRKFEEVSGEQFASDKALLG